MIRLSVLGQEWKFYIHEEDEYINKFGDDSGALVIPAEKTGHFNTEDLSLNCVKHELFHVYLSAVPVHSARLNKTQLEEMCCDVFAEYGDRITRQARILFKLLKEESGL